MARQERIRLPSSTSEKLEVTIEADADPTGATVAFNVTSGEDYDDPDPGDAGWTAGAWVSSSWSAAAGTARALTPVLGSAAATPAADITVTTNSRLWVRVSTGAEAPVLGGPVLVIT